jgi:hypothetical protein
LRRAWLVGAAFVVPVVALAGCGHSSRHSSPRTVTVPAYGVYSQTKVAGSAASGARSCRVRAETFSRGAVQFLAHVRPHGAYPADIYYFLMRQRLAGFEAHRCDVKLLGSALAHALTTRQRRTLVAVLPKTMATTVGKSLDRAGF